MPTLIGRPSAFTAVPRPFTYGLLAIGSGGAYAQSAARALLDHTDLPPAEIVKKALTIAAELGDPRRFPTAPSVMAFVGLVPSEHSSGTKQARGAITKTGNAHLRRVLVEAAWHYRHHPFVGDALRRRQRGASPDAIDTAWRAQHRLARRYRRLIARGKPKQQVVTAVARELTGFLWAALTQ